VIEIDGSQGEGGGQILRSALSLAVCTGKPFRIVGIRAGRAKPGLLRQHLTAVKAAAAISGARVEGDQVGSLTLTFEPQNVRPGEYSFAIGTAGSCTLVLQTVLPPLLTASAPSVIRISGGTHNSAAPPVEFLNRAFLPLINRMGPTVEVRTERVGFFPRGGGLIEAQINPTPQLRPIELLARGERHNAYAEVFIAGIPKDVADRELAVIARRLNWAPEQLKIRGLSGDVGPGNALVLTLEHEHITEVFTSFGSPGRSAESVAEEAASEARAYLAHTSPVGPHLADQLLLPMVLGGITTFSTCAPTPHFHSNCEVIAAFTGRRFKVEQEKHTYTVRAAAND
jgi:RNA 3'-terminal phosphate cyclase (ATP)